MSLLRVATPLASLFLYSVALSQILGPACVVLQWTFNFDAINPCANTAWMMSTCNGGSYVFDSLPPGYPYSGPDGFDASNLCYCNTVLYALFSACGACQGQKWITWSEWVTNCTKILPPSSFPNPGPSGISIPQWAVIDVTIVNDWNASKSFDVGDEPELGSGSIIGNSSATSRRPTPTSSSTDSSRGSSPNAGLIAGGIIGVIVVLIISPAVIALYLRRRRRAQVAVPADVSASQPQPTQSDEVAPSLSGSPITMKFYDPNDPTTFPGYQGDPHSQDIPSQVTMSSNIGTGNTVADTQSSLPQAGLAKGYHGLPTV